MDSAACTHLEAKELLGLDETRPEALFRFGRTADIEAAATALFRRWHPDVCPEPEAGAVARKVGALKQAALAKLARGDWDGRGEFQWDRLDAKPLRARFLRAHRFELGQACICGSAVLFVTEPDGEDFRRAFLRALRSFPFQGSRMQREIAPVLPILRSQGRLADGRGYLVLEKAPSLIRLRDLLRHCGGSIEGRHVAWMVSRLLGICCYLSYAELTHNDLSLDNLYVDPARHGLALLGGWWYAAAPGTRLLGLPQRTVSSLPAWLPAGPRADPRLDLIQVRTLALELLGPRKDAPAALEAWCAGTVGPSALETHAEWTKAVLPACYGPRAFVELPVEAARIYGGD